jgi:hypothetical protein
LAAGLAGDKWSLGFVAETEKQVENHLESHLETLPKEDLRSRAIVDQMRLDEITHGQAAKNAGGANLPEPLQKIMQAMSDYFFTTSVLNGFDFKDTETWMSGLVQKGIPLKTPSPKLVTWSKERSLYKNEFDEQEN